MGQGSATPRSRQILRAVKSFTYDVAERCWSAASRDSTKWNDCCLRAGTRNPALASAARNRDVSRRQGHRLAQKIRSLLAPRHFAIRLDHHLKSLREILARLLQRRTLG